MDRIAFQGAPGAYSHLACRAAHPDHRAIPCGSFDEVFHIVERGEAELAMLPVENSAAGRVADIHRLLPQTTLHIVGEHFEEVHHQLLGLPGAPREGVRTVRSHPQALAQCRAYLQAHDLEPVAARDTAGAALSVVRDGDPTAAALASPLAAELHGLEILEANVEDNHDNTTRFLIMAQHPLRLPVEAEGLITSCLFRVRNLPAALYKALGGFATNHINLLKLESYQLERFTWTEFAIDFEGHQDSPAVRNALEELRFFCDKCRVLGTYRASTWRGSPGAS